MNDLSLLPRFHSLIFFPSSSANPSSTHSSFFFSSFLQPQIITRKTQAEHLGVGRPRVDVLVVRLDERPDRALVDEVADRGARERAVDAEAVGEDRGGDHLVLGDLLDELVVGGLTGFLGWREEGVERRKRRGECFLFCLMEIEVCFFLLPLLSSSFLSPPKITTAELLPCRRGPGC